MISHLVTLWRTIPIGERIAWPIIGVALYILAAGIAAIG